MTYSIQEGISDLEKKLAAERAIAERFPDAYLGDRADGVQIWWSEDAAPHVTDIEIVHVKSDYASHLQTILIYPYLSVEGMRVYSRATMPTYHHVWLESLKKQHPEAYNLMVAAAVR